MNAKTLLAFGATAVQAVLTTPFFVAYVHKAYIEGVTLDESHIGDMLSSALYVARHTPVFMMNRSGEPLGEKSSYRCVSYTWSHPTIRPWGSHLPLQCPGCGALASLRCKQLDKGTIATTCMNTRCEERRIYPKPADVRVVKHGEVGHWLARVVGS